MDWSGLESPLAKEVLAAGDRALAAYAENPTLLHEHVNIERATAEGGYERRQLFELIQNGADALLESPDRNMRGRIEVVLTDEALYCANEGEPFNLAGLTALLHSHLSPKRGFEIGRFGLGFKSVLAVTDQPAVISRSISFEFDPHRSKRRIQDAVKGAELFPVLRLAEPIDPFAHSNGDDVLEQLMTWATTIVKLPRTREAAHLADDLEDFPAGFLLFSPHVGRVRLSSTETGLDREIRMVHDLDGVIELADGPTVRRWRTISTVHRLSPHALAGAGEFSEREEVPIHWAVPVEHTAARGHFWAFFPTHYETTLSGVLNAPWKTQEDRQNLLEGDFNEELIDAAASMIVSHCSILSTPDDPALHLDKFPARGRESPNWADQRLTDRVYDAATDLGRCLPDLEGVLRRSADLCLHPRSIPSDALDIWASVPGRSSDWCHSSVDGRDRRPRAERILARPVATHDEWLAALLAVGTVEASIAAVRILERLQLNELTRRTPAVLTADGSWVPADPQRVFLLDEPRERHGLRVVAPEVAASPEARRALEALGIRTLDALGELDAFLASSPGKWERTEWRTFWRLTRRVSVDSCLDLLRQRGVVDKIEVQTYGRGFRRIHATLLPGEIVGADAPATLDMEVHRQDMELLRALGAVEAPHGGRNVTTEEWFLTYREAQRDAYLAQMTGTGPRPLRELLVLDQREAVGPLGVLPGLSAAARARFTHAALAQTGVQSSWSMRHRTQTYYPVVNVMNPTVWMLRRYGAVETSFGVRAIDEAYGPAFSRYSRWLPVAGLDDTSCELLGIENEPSRVSSAVWTQAVFQATATGDPTDLGSLYAQAAQAEVTAPVILAAFGIESLVETASITVVPADDSGQRLILENRGDPFVVVDEPRDADVLVERWHLRRPDPTVQVEVVTVEAGEAEDAADVFPLAPLKVGDVLIGVTVVRARDVQLRIPSVGGTTTRPVEAYWEGQRLIVDDDLDEATLLDLLLEHAGISLADRDRQEILQQRALEDVEAVKRRCRDAKNDAARLLQLVDLGHLRAALPAGLVEAVIASRGRSLSPEEIAELVLAVHGIDVLGHFRAVLEERSLRVPTLNGGVRARRFVADLGFQRAFAGSRPEPRDPLVRVPSPPFLPPLHHYQAQLVHEVRGLLRRDETKRALLSLPTGAGKTRVAVEAIIGGHINREVDGPVMWIAQSDELCEQAVQTWIYLWRAMGPGGTLAISRLWGTNEIEPVDDDLQVVVATVQKLKAIDGHPDYDWVREADCIVVDEAHTSTTPMYTDVLSWLGFTGRSTRENSCLLGLTATPFRGVSESETERLVARYGRWRLDHGVFGDDDPYEELQRIGVLAKVEHRLLGGSTLHLSQSELAELNELRRLPRTVEQRLGEDRSRNGVLLDQLLSFPPDWTSILFSTSVQHAELMAALLTLEGVRAEAISAGTDAGRRRYAIEEFRSGRIRVLTNYGVLTQGFDAPKVRAIVVARPTYSPNVYQQMIGRGLRGPANGGSDSCLIVNVEDTVEQFGEQLAFRQFEYLWSQS